MLPEGESRVKGRYGSRPQEQPAEWPDLKPQQQAERTGSGQACEPFSKYVLGRRVRVTNQELQMAVSTIMLANVSLPGQGCSPDHRAKPNLVY